MLALDKSNSAHRSNFFTLDDSADWHFAGDFTIELFGVEFADTNTAVLLNDYNATASERSWRLQYASGALAFIGSTNGSGTTVISYTWTPTLNTPYDIAVERSGSAVRIYVDGTMVASGTIAGALFDAAQPLVIGAGDAAGSLPFTGLARALRITNGTARYATDTSYTVPTLPLPTS